MVAGLSLFCGAAMVSGLSGCQSDETSAVKMDDKPVVATTDGDSWVYGGDRDWPQTSVEGESDETLAKEHDEFHGLPQDLDIWPAVLKTDDPMGYALTDEPDTVAGKADLASR